MKTRNVVKIIGLILFITLALYFFRASPLSEELSKEAIRAYVESSGAAAPLIYILVYIVGACLLIPGTIITAAGAVAFGTLWGTILTLIGATLGASASFLLARLMGRDFVDSLLKGKWKRLEKYDEWLEKEGFAAVFYLRLVFFPFNALNFGAGLTKVKFKDYFWGTFLGIIPGTFIFTFFFDSITNVSSFADLLQWEIILSLILFVVSFAIPAVVKRGKKNSYANK